MVEVLKKKKKMATNCGVIVSTYSVEVGRPRLVMSSKSCRAVCGK